MIPRVPVKRVLRQIAGCVSAATAPFTPRDGHPHVCILVYHRIAEVGFTDPFLDNWNVSPARFASQIAALADFAEFISLREIAGRVRSGPHTKPLVCLTFDDGYGNFFSNAFPVLQRFNIPAALFVVTSFIGGADPMAFDRWGRRHKARAAADAWQPASWRDVERGTASSLLTIGAHSHRHLNGRDCTVAELTEEAERSRAILRDRLGADHAWAYSYPYGSSRLRQTSPEYVEAVRAAGYDLALSTDLGLASSESDPLCLPRVETHAGDFPAVLRAKVRGALAPYYLVDRLRQGTRSG